MPLLIPVDCLFIKCPTQFFSDKSIKGTLQTLAAVLHREILLQNAFVSP